VCDTQLVDLTCHCAEANVNEDLYLITWQCGSNQIQHNKTISIQAGLTEVLCTCNCEAFDSGQNIGNADITVVANGE